MHFFACYIFDHILLKNDVTNGKSTKVFIKSVMKQIYLHHDKVMNIVV